MTVIDLDSPAIRKARRENELEREAYKLKRKSRNYQNTHKTYERRVGKMLYDAMQPGRIYTMGDLEAVARVLGLKRTCVGPGTTQMVSDEMMERVDRGQYRKI